MPAAESVPDGRHRYIIACLVLLLLAFAGASSAQDLIDPSPSSGKSDWVSPDLANLPSDWWHLIQEGVSDEQLWPRIEAFQSSLNDAVGQLDGEQLVAGRTLLQSIRTQFQLLRLARSETEAVDFEPLPVRETYSLDQFLALNARAAELKRRRPATQLRLDELQRQVELLRDRQDNLLGQYEETDSQTPERILLGLRLVETRLEIALAVEESRHFEERLEQIEAQSQQVAERSRYARDHLVAEEVNRDQRKVEIEAANEQVLELTGKVASVQNQLLDALSSPDAKPSLLVLRKQQLTRVSVEQALARLEYYELQARTAWQRQRGSDGELNTGKREKLEEADVFIQETRGQMETWTAASRATLLSVPPGDSLNAAKNIELAQSVAKETLAYLDRADRTIEDLRLLAELITTDQIIMQHGLRSIWVRTEMLFERVGETLSSYLDITLFHVGEVPVTVGSIITMLLILLLGFAISLFIRHLVDRLRARRQFASSPAVYTLGRLLHYLIIFVAVLAAFGSIGLDFSNFALIAGALSVGIGFGLQSVVNNFVSGLILLFEGSLRVGDYIELDTGLRGVVKEINTRATIVRTNDSVDLVVPNSKFVTNDLTNWTLREPLARFRIEFGVAYGSDKEKVREAAIEAANRVDYIVHNMPSRPVEVWLVGFGDSALVFQLLAWVSKAGVRRPERVRAAVLWELETQLAERGIEIPFPQRDLHLRSGFLEPGDDTPVGDPGITSKPHPD